MQYRELVLLEKLQELTAPDADFDYSVLRGKMSMEEVRIIREGLQVAIEHLQDKLSKGGTMNSKRYQLWMCLMSHSPGNPVDTQSRANFTYRIIDTQAAETTAYLRWQQDQVLEDGYSFWGHSEDASRLENFARVTMQAVKVQQ